MYYIHSSNIKFWYHKLMVLKFGIIAKIFMIKITIKIAFILAKIIGIKVAKTKNNFVAIKTQNI